MTYSRSCRGPRSSAPADSLRALRSRPRRSSPSARLAPLLLEQGEYQQNEMPVSPGPLHAMHLTPAEAEMLRGVPIGLLDIPSTDVPAEDVPGLPAVMAGRVILRIVREVVHLPGDENIHGAEAPEPGQPLLGPVRRPGNHDRLDIANVKSFNNPFRLDK